MSPAPRSQMPRRGKWASKHTQIEQAALGASIALIAVLSVYVLVAPEQRLLLGLYMVLFPVGLLGFALRGLAFDQLAERLSRGFGRHLASDRSYERFSDAVTLTVAGLILWVLHDVIAVIMAGRDLLDIGLGLLVLSLLLGAFLGDLLTRAKRRESRKDAPDTASPPARN
ncbi:hypothetical protein [Marimonas lutisalis]|uniref:hypothetical protein n=1 Tax=Marimonas lutisalis TaxID=2545756 RepID=UPI0010F96ACA|nr:hypothetical protein [Marimonas lutisalis]